MTKALFLLLALAGLLVTVDNSQAGLGWSYDQCVQHYGQIVIPNRQTRDGSIACHFSVRGYEITAFFDSNTVSRITYTRASGFDTASVDKFLTSNCPGTVWVGPEKDNSDGSYRWTGSENGAYAFSASLDDGNALTIWTKEDNDYILAHHAQEASGL
jgi:hypothetical protein